MLQQRLLLHCVCVCVCIVNISIQNINTTETSCLHTKQRAASEFEEEKWKGRDTERDQRLKMMLKREGTEEKQKIAVK